VKPRIRARDTFGNESVLDLGPLEMTRLRWAYPAGTPATGAAIGDDGHVIVGLSSTTNNLLTIDGSGSKVRSVTVAKPPATTGSFITSAPSIGAKTWVGSSDGLLYGVDSTFSLVGPACPTTAASGTMFTPAVRVAPTEAAYSGGSAGKVYGASSAGCLATPPAVVLGNSPAIAGDKVYALDATGALSRYTSGLADESFLIPAPAACADVPSPMLHAHGFIVFACGIAGAHAQIHQADIALKTTTLLANLTSKPSASPVVFPTGDLLVGTNDGKLHRLEQASAWNDAWSTAASLGAAVRGVAISAPDADGVVAYATTAQGQLHAVDKDGRTVWSTSAEPAPEPLGVSALSFPTIAPADAARAGSLPTLYAGSDDGHVYAVVVDTGLDPASPWPKAHRDLRNTSNADAPKDW
jgi:outer membrane protein assembly factor BamB